jgi:DNA-binding MarR family transcriptional regulator
MTDTTPDHDPRSAPASGQPSEDGCAAFYRVNGYSPDESVGYLMRRIIASLGQEVDRELEPAGLTNAQWVPLLKLHMGAASTVAELARECQLDAGSMTRMLDRLEAKTLVRRVRSSRDRRVVNLELTDEGRQVAQGIPSVLCRVQNAHLDGFSVEEWQQLKTLLRRMLANTRSGRYQAAGPTPPAAPSASAASDTPASS